MISPIGIYFEKDQQAQHWPQPDELSLCPTNPL